MLGENFVYFFAVQGFFVGIIFGILKSFNAEDLLLYTLFITTKINTKDMPGKEG